MVKRKFKVDIQACLSQRPMLGSPLLVQSQAEQLIRRSMTSQETLLIPDLTILSDASRAIQMLLLDLLN